MEEVVEEIAEGMVKSGGRETFWVCLAGLVALGSASVYLDSATGVEIFKASIMPVMVLGLGVFGFHKASGIMAGRKY